MSEWKAKRFWTECSVAELNDGFEVRLDARPLRTPLKSPLVLPTRAMATAIAAEWDSQQGEIAPLTMPATRAANAAIDKVIPQFDEVAEMLTAYGDSDQLCYRADAPAELVTRQADAWDPYLDWAAERFGARLAPRTGLMHVPQDETALAKLSAEVRAQSPFQLAALHDLIGLSGSLVLGLAAAHGHRDADQIWQDSRVDETFQAEQWGLDEEAAEEADTKRQSFLNAKIFYDLGIT